MPFEYIWGKLKRKEQIRLLHWIVSCVSLSVLKCHDKQLNSLNNPIWTNVWLTNNSTSILTTINCLFSLNCKNDVFYPRICKHALYESSEWFCHAPRKPANPCLAGPRRTLPFIYWPISAPWHYSWVMPCWLQECANFLFSTIQSLAIFCAS